MTQNDDDRTMRSQVTMRLDRDLLAIIDGLAKEEGVDRTELVRRLLADGLAHRRIDLALADYAAGRRSAWSAAEAAGVDLYVMLDRIAEAGVPYWIDPGAIRRLRDGGGGSTPPGKPTRPRATRAATSDEASITALRARYKPSRTRILFVGESSPAGGTHFYRGDSNLYRATREAFGRGLSVTSPPEGEAFLAWFQELGCWLVDVADHPVNRSTEGERMTAVAAGVLTLARTIREVQPTRIVVLLRRIASDVRRAAAAADFDDRDMDVLPFPTRQWRPVYVNQLAAMLADVYGKDQPPSIEEPLAAKRHATRVAAEDPAEYRTRSLHDAIALILRRHDNSWMKASAIAREIAYGDLWSRPTDGRHPPASQISARAKVYAAMFQTSDLGIRLRVS